MTDVSQLRELCKAATPGPWKECGALRSGCVCGLIWAPDDEHIVAAASPPSDEVPPVGNARADAALIVAAVNALPALLDEVERLRSGVRELAEAAEEYGPLSPNRAAYDRLSSAVAALKNGGRP